MGTAVDGKRLVAEYFKNQWKQLLRNRDMTAFLSGIRAQMPLLSWGNKKNTSNKSYLCSWKESFLQKSANDLK